MACSWWLHGSYTDSAWRRHGVAMVAPVLYGHVMVSPWRVNRGFMIAP